MLQCIGSALREVREKGVRMDYEHCDEAEVGTIEAPSLLSEKLCRLRCAGMPNSLGPAPAPVLRAAS